MTAVHRIVVLRALPGLGDLLCGVPALRAIRAADPGAEISYIGLGSGTWLASRFPALIDRYVELPAWPGIPEATGPMLACARFLREMRRERFDLALQLHGDGSVTNELIELLGASRTAGLSRPGDIARDPLCFPPVPEAASEVERALMPVRACGIREHGRHLELPESVHDRRELAAAWPGFRPGYVVLHPGAALASRRWSPAGFALVADALAARGLIPVLTGVGSERAIVAEVRRQMHCSSVDLSGRLSLGAAGALVARAAMVVTNDTGMSHLAAAKGTCSVVLFRVTDPKRWKPERDRHIAVMEGDDVEATAAAVLDATKLAAAAA